MEKKNKHYIIKAGDFTVRDARSNPGMELAISRWVNEAEYAALRPGMRQRSIVGLLMRIDVDDTVTLDAGRDARQRYCLCRVTRKQRIAEPGHEDLATGCIYVVFMQSLGVSTNKSVRDRAEGTIY